MCVAVEISTKITNLLDEALTEQKRLTNELSLLDKKLSDIYHDLESAKFNAVQGYKIAKYIQELVIQRRLIKHELYPLDSFISSIGANQMKQKFHSVTDKAKNKVGISPTPRNSLEGII